MPSQSQLILYLESLLFHLRHVVAEALQQPSSPLKLIQQLRQKLAVHLPSRLHKGRLDEGCLLLQAAAAHGTQNLLPAAKYRTAEADLASQVTFTLYIAVPCALEGTTVLFSHL